MDVSAARLICKAIGSFYERPELQLQGKCQRKHTVGRLIVRVRRGPRAARFHAEPTIVSDMATPSFGHVGGRLSEQVLDTRVTCVFVLYAVGFQP